MILRNTAVAASLLLALSATHAQTQPLNDTGQTQCYDADDNEVSCDVASVGDAAGLPRQDGRFGRDPQAGVAPPARLVKIGGGAAGFDFTKICMSGEAAGEGSCPADPPQGTGAHEWACTRDNVTGLIWSLHTFSSINWNDASATSSGSPIELHNVTNRCGFSTNWRVPTRRELLSLAHDGRGATPWIDTDYFPATLSGGYWTIDAVAPFPDGAWCVSFYNGGVYSNDKLNINHVRLVRSKE